MSDEVLGTCVVCKSPLTGRDKIVTLHNEKTGEYDLYHTKCRDIQWETHITPVGAADHDH